MKTENIKTFSYFANEEGDYTICYDVDGDNQTPVLSQRSERGAQIVCDCLNKILTEKDNEIKRLKNSFSISDEEINAEVKEHSVSGEPKNTKLYREGIVYGAKWMRDKIYKK